MLLTCPSLALFSTEKGIFPIRAVLCPLLALFLSHSLLKYAGFSKKAFVCSYLAFPLPNSVLKETYYPTGAISFLSFTCSFQASFFIRRACVPIKAHFCSSFSIKKDLFPYRSNYLLLTRPSLGPFSVRNGLFLHKSSFLLHTYLCLTPILLKEAYYPHRKHFLLMINIFLSSPILFQKMPGFL